MAGKNKPGRPPRCEICRTLENVEVAPDPYRSEIGGDPTPRPLCTKCRNERREEI